MTSNPKNYSSSRGSHGQTLPLDIREPSGQDHAGSNCLKLLSCKPRLADDRFRRTNAKFVMIGHDDGKRGVGQRLLHDPMRAFLANENKATRLQDRANFTP